MFDANSFMNSVTTEVNDTKVKPCPVGEYPATVKEVKASSGTGKNGLPWARLDVICLINDHTGAVEAATGAKEKQVRGGIMLDITEAGGLDNGTGKNVRLGRLREAAGMNKPGQAFSPAMLQGMSLRVKIGHRADPQDASTVYDEVTGFAPL